MADKVPATANWRPKSTDVDNQDAQGRNNGKWSKATGTSRDATGLNTFTAVVKYISALCAGLMVSEAYTTEV